MKYWSFALYTVLAVGCSTDNSPRSLTLATTTSTRDSGLLDALLPEFEGEASVDVKVIAVGTGQALALARKGDADVLMTHAPGAEQAFMDAGFGRQREQFMYNDFVLVGPAEDPLQIRQARTVSEALANIAASSVQFVSRGDDSGTHRKEKTLWESAGVRPEGEWYLESGTGMAATLRIANERRAYVLTDRSTYLAQRKSLDLEIVHEGGEALKNVYSVMIVNSERHPHINLPDAQAFAKFLQSPDTQKRIAEYGITEYGQPLFFVD